MQGSINTWLFPFLILFLLNYFPLIFFLFLNAAHIKGKKVSISQLYFLIVIHWPKKLRWASQFI